MSKPSPCKLSFTAAFLAGIALLGESASTPRLICIGLIVAGIAGLKFLGK